MNAAAPRKPAWWGVSQGKPPAPADGLPVPSFANRKVP